MKKLKIIHLIGIFLLLLMSTPVIYLLLQVFNRSEIPLKSTLLLEYFKNTTIMIGIVGISSSFIGVLSAWIVSFYNFPFRKTIKILFALPLAIPPYMSAFSYFDFMYSGGLFSKFLKIFGYNGYFDIANFWGANFIYILTLYPYVYIICLSFFKNSSASLIDNARVLNANPLKLFFKVGLPMSRLPIVAGATLVIMEMISDFGVVDYYGIQVFSTGIYKVWLNYGDFNSAIKLSAIFLILILIILLFENFFRRKLRYFTTSKSNVSKLIETTFKGRLFIYTFFVTLLVFALFIPLIQLLHNASYSYLEVINKEFFKIVLDTIYYSSISAIICVFISLILANFTKYRDDTFTTFISRLSTMGYSVPGIIIGLAVIFTFIDIDKILVPFYRMIGITDKVLVISTSVYILLIAYCIRFMAVSYNNIYSGYRKINPNLFKASLTLGKSSFKSFWSVDFPILIPTLLTSFLLVFLEIIKELPITLMLKPYNVETLTARVYTHMHNEDFLKASIPSLTIIFLGIVVMIFTMLYRENENVKSKKY